MIPAIYPSVGATDQVDHAQAEVEVDAHVTSGVDGHCPVPLGRGGAV